MAWWEWLLDAVGIALLVVVVYGAALMLRRKLVSRHGGTFELGYRLRRGKAGRGWALGIGRYSGSSLEWFRVFSLSPRPRRRWERVGLSYETSRTPEGTEAWEIYPGHVVVVCDSTFGTVELAMSRSSLIGFQAWLESRNPGTDWNYGK